MLSCAQVYCRFDVNSFFPLQILKSVAHVNDIQMFKTGKCT